MTSCGATDERTAAALHGIVLAFYVLMAAWHAFSVVVHLRRAG